MDEKGFFLGRITKAKRIFPKDLWASQKLLGAGQDGSREWITLVATICADGSVLPPLLIYDSTSGSMQVSWVQDFNSNEHQAWFTASPDGWTSDDIGFKWLEGLFKKETQSKARRLWRLRSLFLYIPLILRIDYSLWKLDVSPLWLYIIANSLTSKLDSLKAKRG